MGFKLVSCKQFIGHGLYVAFIFDIIVRDDTDNHIVKKEKGFYIGQVIKMVNLKTATRTRIALSAVSANCKIFCRWFKKVEDSSVVTTVHTYEWGPAEDNNLFILGRFAICQVRLTKNDPEDTSLSAKYTLHSDDHNACEQYVSKAEELQAQIDQENIDALQVNESVVEEGGVGDGKKTARKQKSKSSAPTETSNKSKKKIKK